VKCTNILLDAQFNAKVGDFGISKMEAGFDPGATGVKGTIGMDWFYNTSGVLLADLVLSTFVGKLER
jgi:hypothetical protein